ncbi:hypothetical protein GCM10023237_44970 [Streptomyces coeruleoprunus]
MSGGTMHEMSKGANVGLAALSDDAGAVVVSLSWSSPEGDGDADVSVLLLDENGKVRGDDDFYFYNHPAAADGSVQLLGKTPSDDGDVDRISIDLSAVPPDVVRIVVAASQYGDAQFGDLDNLRLTLADRSGEVLLGFSIDDAGVESAFIFGELYRRGEEWKFRAVGQGYETGLAGLATDFGIDITDEGGGDGEDEGRGVEAAPEPAAPPTAVPSVPPQRTGDVPRPTEEAKTPARRRRTVKKKITLPKVAVKSLAENDSWQSARLFPAPSLKSDKERELRATSVLLSVWRRCPSSGGGSPPPTERPRAVCRRSRRSPCPTATPPGVRTASSASSARASCGPPSSRRRPTAIPSRRSRSRATWTSRPAAGTRR